MRALELPSHIRHLGSEMSPLWPLTSMRVGGPARWLAQPKSETDLIAVFTWIQAHHLPYLILGGGTNVLFPDDGFPGVVVLTSKLKGIQMDDLTVTVACGESLSGFTQRMNRVGLSGMEWACGIPGSIGGAVVMNAGTPDGDIASVLRSVRIATAEGVKELSSDQLELGYRTSALGSGNLEGIVLEATFVLRGDEPQHCLSREREVLEARHRTQPTGASSGCIFKNPQTGPSAGELLDRAGCKSMRIGDAYVSELHANFILNEGKNNAGEVLELIQQMKSRVVETFSIHLEPEVIIVE